MKQLSVEQAFRFAQAVAVREWRLLLPVALAFVALPGLMVDVFLPNAMQALMPNAAPDPAAQGRAMLAVLAVFAVNMAGALAITALALVPGISVQEAIGRAFRRIAPLAGAGLMVAAALVAGLLVVALALGAARLGTARLQAVLLAAVFGVGAVLWVRLCLLVPVLVERGGGPGAALVRSWRLTQGASWRTGGALAVYFVGGMVVVVALSSAIGAVVALLAKAAGAAEVAMVLNAVVFRLVTTVVSTGFQLLIAGLYRGLAPRGA